MIRRSVAFVCDDETLEIIDKLAKQDGVTRSRMVGLLIEAGLDVYGIKHPHSDEDWPEPK